MTKTRTSLAIVGGTGKLGYSLARRWAKAGYAVILGSRDPEKAILAAAELAQQIDCHIEGASNAIAAARADVVIVTVPYASQYDILSEIRTAVAGKLVVDTTVPLMPPNVMRVQLPVEGSAALRAQGLLGETVKVVAAFHSIAAHKLAMDVIIDCDVLVFGNSKEARAQVVVLAEAAGMRGIHGGSLANSAAAEALTSVLIFVNRTYKVDGAGIRITGELKLNAES
jgi:NADPH-dependent F420 reductase